VACGLCWGGETCMEGSGGERDHIQGERIIL
jgi:hypothetical protein